MRHYEVVYLIHEKHEEEVGRVNEKVEGKYPSPFSIGCLMGKTLVFTFLSYQILETYFWIADLVMSLMRALTWELRFFEGTVANGRGICNIAAFFHEKCLKSHFL